MKRIIAAIAAVSVVCACMSACTSISDIKEQISAVSSEPEAGVVSQVSSVVSEPVVSEPVVSEPVVSEHKSKLVEINIDNYTDYFEEALIETIDIDSDDMGIVSMAIARYNLKLKDEYLSKLDLNNTEAEIKATVYGTKEAAFISEQDGTAVIGDVLDDSYGTFDDINFGNVVQLRPAQFVPRTDDGAQLLELAFINELGYMYDLNEGNGGSQKSYFRHFVNPEVVEIEGTIALFD